MVSNPQFKQADLEPEKNVVFEEFRRSLDNPSQLNFSNIQKNSFSGSYSHPILGTEKSIKSFTLAQLNDFRNKFYNTETALLLIGGELPENKKLTKTINSYSLPQSKISHKKSKFKLKDEAYF